MFRVIARSSRPEDFANCPLIVLPISDGRFKFSTKLTLCWRSWKGSAYGNTDFRTE
jgi:hypothetical protein